MTWTLQATFGYGQGGYGQGGFGGSFPSGNINDIELIQRMQYLLLENGAADANGTSLLTTMFTFQQLIDSLNLAQEKFLRDTACVLTRATQGTTPQVPRYLLPDGVTGSAPIPPQWIHTRDVTWQNLGAGGPFPAKTLARTDTWQLDHELADWQQNSDLPTLYNDGSDLPTLTLEIAKAPSEIGQLELDYVALPVTLNGVLASPVNLSIPDECESAVLYGALAQLLAQDGEGHDAERAQYCEIRYQMAVDLTKMLMEGM